MHIFTTVVDGKRNATTVELATVNNCTNIVDSNESSSPNTITSRRQLNKTFNLIPFISTVLLIGVIDAIARLAALWCLFYNLCCTLLLMSPSLLLWCFIVEEFRKKQGKSHLSDNLKYFLETGYKATDSETSKVRQGGDPSPVTAIIRIDY